MQESAAQNSLGVKDQQSSCEKLLRRGKFKKAKSCFENILTFKPNNVKILVRLAEVNYRLGNTAEVKKYVSRSVEMNPVESYNPLVYLANQMSFKQNNALAVFILDKLGNNLSDGTKKEKVTALKNSYLLKKYELNTPRYNVVLNNMGDAINSEESEYLPALSLDGKNLVFTRRVGGANEDFFISTLDSNGLWTDAKNMGYPPNTSFPDGGAKLSADGNYLFFTRCDQRSSNGLEGGGCDLVFCYKEMNDGKAVWSSPQYFGFTINTTAYEGQPCLSSDEQSMYFVSERVDGFGGKDIYVSHFENGLWSKPINLGSDINSSGNETAPFIHPDNETLYFSSDGHPTLGSSDLFVSRRINDTTWQKPSNLGRPINSAGFDGSITVNAKGTKGYLASERKNGRGKLDIYSFDLYKGIKPIPTLVVKGFLKDKYTNRREKKQRITIYTWPEMQLLSEHISNKGDASYYKALHIGKQYLIASNVNGFRPFYKILDLRKDTFPDILKQDIRLREPGLLDTLYKNKWQIDTVTNTLDTLALTEIEKVKANWNNWSADSSNVKINLTAYHYYGDSDSDTAAAVYISECLARIKMIREAFAQAEIPPTSIILSIEPYIWRDEREEFERVDIDIVEFY